MRQFPIKIGGREFVINEPVFGVLKTLIHALNRLQSGTQSDVAIFQDVMLIFESLLGDAIKKLHWWQRPKISEIETLLQKLPEFLGLEPENRGSGTSVHDSWDELYCVLIDRTGWDL